MRKFKRFSIFLLVGILLFSLFFTACGTNTGNQSGSSDPASESSSSPDESSDSTSNSLDPSYQPYQPTSDEFREDLVIVLIKAEYSEVNKPWYEEDFQLKGIGIEKIVDIRYEENPSEYSASPNFAQLLELTLSEPSKENVIAAIHQIEILYFVEWAIPRYIYDVDYDYEPDDEQYEGTLYALEQAYEEGKITREQLLNIAYHQGSAEYNQEEINENFTPIPKGDLTEEVSLEIRTALAAMHREYTGYENITAEDFSISSNYYYGCYNNYHVFFFENVSGIDSYPTWDYEYNEEIDGVTFHFNFPIVQTIYVYG